MRDRTLVDMAAQAGEIMLVSGAEIYRVEDTVARILRASGASGAEVVVMATGIFITLTSGEGEPLSVVRRVRGRSTNMNRICRVNAYALMVFCLLYTPCSAAVSAVRTETGDGKWTACMAVFQLALAFLAASAVYQTGCLLFPG